MHAATAAAGQVCRPADPGKGPDLQAHAWLHHASAASQTFDTTAAHTWTGLRMLNLIGSHVSPVPTRLAGEPLQTGPVSGHPPVLGQGLLPAATPAPPGVGS